MTYINTDDNDIDKIVCKAIKNIAFIFAIVFLFWLLTGCTVLDNATKPDPDFKQGCKVKISAYQIGVFNQAGGIETCKLKCSESLPEGFKYNYDRNGCKISIGE